MKIQAGDRAPQFAATSIDGKKISLQDYAQRPIFLSFFKWATCPLCNLRIQKLIQHRQQLAHNGLQIIGVFHSPAAKLQSHMAGKAVPFPIIADPDMALYKKYGVSRSTLGVLRGSLRLGDFAQIISNRLLTADLPDGSLNVLPANFLINADGTIHTAYYGKDIGDHLPMEKILAFASSKNIAPQFG